MVKISFRQKANEDLNNIWNYTYENWSENQADKYYATIKFNCLEIGKNPNLGKIYNGISRNLLGLKSGKHIIFLLTLVNSNLLNWYFFNFQSEGLHFYPDDAKQFPIIKITKSCNQEPFIIKSNKMLELNKDQQKLLSSFIKYLQSQFNIEKPSKKLENWHELEFADFIKELNKAIKKAGSEKLSKKDEMEWMELFDEKKAEVQTLKTEIEKTDKEIDQMVYELYGLTKDEIKIVEGSV